MKKINNKKRWQVIIMVLSLGLGALNLGNVPSSAMMPIRQWSGRHVIVTDESNPPISNVQSPISG